IVLTGENALEAVDGVLERNDLAVLTGEHLGDVEGLRQEALDLTRTVHDALVFFRQFVHTQNRDDVLQFLVTLQHGLHATGHLVVLVAHDQRIELAGGGVQRVHGGVDTQRGDVTAQHDGGVQVREGGRGARVGQVVGGDVHGLDGSNGAVLGGG